MAEPELPYAVQRGIAALERRLGGEGVLRRVPSRGRELAGFDLKLPPDFLGVERTARIGFSSTFPQSGLSIQIEPSAFLEWPHVMEGSVCLFGARDEPAGGDPDEVVFKTLDRLGELLRMAASAVSQAERDAEFGREIRSYWGQQLRHTTDFQLVLAELPPGAVPLFAFSEPQQKQGIQTVVLGTQQEGIRETSTRLGLGTGKIRDPATAGFFLPLASIPSVRLPTPYRLLDWLRPACAPTDLAAVEAWLAAEAHPTRFLVLRLPNAGGTPVFQPLILRSSGLGKARPLNLGRRAGRRAPSVPLAGPLAGISDVLLHVMAPEVVHSRALEAPGKLAHAHIVLVGVGTLGGAMAVNLARAGVGRLTLVDPDNLEADNLGRHPLGARELGQKKAEALARRLYEDVPTVEVSAIPTHVQWGGQKAAEALAAASLVLVSSADWRSELWLWELKRSGVAWAMVQVWSEPHAVAGHALVSPSACPDDPQGLFEANGEFRHCYSLKWPDGGVVLQPACGESFIPGGPVALAAIAAMGAQAAIDVLAGNVVTPQWHALSRGAATVEAAGGVYCGPHLADGVISETRVRPWPPAPEAGT